MCTVIPGVPNICKADYGIDFVRWANHFSANLDKSNTVPSTEHAQLFHGNLSTVTPLNTVWSAVIRRTYIPVGTSLWPVSIGGGRGRTLGGCTLMMAARTQQSQARHCMYLREYSHVITSGVMWSSVARQHTFIGEVKSSQRFRLIDEIPEQRIFILRYELTAGTKRWNIVRFQISTPHRCIVRTSVPCFEQQRCILPASPEDSGHWLCWLITVSWDEGHHQKTSHQHKTTPSLHLQHEYLHAEWFTRVPSARRGIPTPLSNYANRFESFS